MTGDGQFGRVPPVLRDAGEDDGDVYVVGVRESTALTEDAASTLGMPQHTHFILDLARHQRELLGRGLQPVLTSGRADAVPRLLRV